MKESSCKSMQVTPAVKKNKGFPFGYAKLKELLKVKVIIKA